MIPFEERQRMGSAKVDPSALDSAVLAELLRSLATEVGWNIPLFDREILMTAAQRLTSD